MSILPGHIQAHLVGEGKLRPLIGTVRPWSELLSVVQGYADRTFAGKAVLTLP